MFVNGVLFNSEIWQGLKPKDLDILSIVDHKILRYICQAQAKIPTEFLYLEAGALPLPFIVASRRMIYLQNILKRNPEELVKRVFIAQKNNPTEGDYINLVQEDFSLAKIPYDENAITAMGEDQYKEYIKKHIQAAAFSHLTMVQKTHIKVNKIRYENLHTQPYLINPDFSNEEVAQLIALRSHTIRGIKTNFSTWYKPDLACQFKCIDSQDSQEHLLNCKPLQAKLTPSQIEAVKQINYNDIYENTIKQKEAVTIFTWLLNAREQLLNNHKPTSGPTLDAAPAGGSRGP